MPRITYNDKDAESYYNENDVNQRVVGENKDASKAQMKQVLGDDYQSMRDGLIKEGVNRRLKRGESIGDPVIDNPSSSWLRRAIYGR